MSHQVLWTKVVVEEFIRIGGLTKEEEHVMRTRADGHTIVQQSLELGMSTRTVERIVRTLKRKYDAVQPYSVILPPRRHSAKELYMDNN